LFWTPAFLKAEYGMTGTQVAVPIAVLYTIATFGSIYGGYLPLQFVNQGRSVFDSRRLSMLIYAFCALPVIFAQYLGSFDMWLAILIIGIAASGHQAWSANIFTYVSDMFPKKAVGSIVGIGGMAGSIGGVLVAKIGTTLFDHYKALGHIQTGYYIMFFFCGGAYLLAWVIMRLLVPKMKQIDL
jgi:ACS family hexuronate transporter-like MFS transporter